MKRISLLIYYSTCTMEILNAWVEYDIAKWYMHQAAVIAKDATCLRVSGWSVIVSGNDVIWIGFNGPPKNLESQRRCLTDKKTYHRKVVDKTCCIHAEQRAIFDALKKYPDKITGSTLYFTRIDKNWEIIFSWEPYCTGCSKMALEAWVKYFVLWQEQWICIYDTEEYNTLSYQFNIGE